MLTFLFSWQHSWDINQLEVFFLISILCNSIESDSPSPASTLTDRIGICFDYYLCLGVEDNLLAIVNNQGSLELVPVVDEDNNPLWDVLEDTEDEYLTKEIESIIENKKS